MRTSIYILFFSLLFTKVSAQNFAPIGAKWIYDVTSGAQLQLVTIESIGEQNILNKTCKKLNVVNVYTTMKMDGTYKYDSTSSFVYVFSENKKIYLFDSVFNVFNLLYNFSAKQNDTIIVHDTCIKPYNYCDNYNCSNFKYSIDSTDSIIINNIKLQRLYISPLTESNWSFNVTMWNEYFPIIEKIGSLKYLLGVSECQVMEGGIAELRCYQDSNISFVSKNWNSNLPCNYLPPLNPTNIIEKKFNNSFVSMNLKSNNITLTFNETQNYSIKIYSIIGAELLSINDTKESIVIETQQLKAGIYLLEITNNNQKIIKKIIKK